MKTLVAIANHGIKNNKYLTRLLDEYRSMKGYQIDIVVLSDIPKNLGSDIEVVVGLPVKDPWSLPFGYKVLFADRMEKYDLFIYSEDDTLVTERNINAFVQVTKVLPDQYIAGFIRYEISDDGKIFYSSIHGCYHWDPKSVFKISEYIFAHYTNEHSACFMMTQNQLKRAIDSGGFFQPPRTGRYDMLVTAATDPYTQCEMKKLICISHLDEFCLHHLPNIYIGKIGLDAESAIREIEKLKTINATNTILGPLFDTSTLLEDAAWDRKYYEPPRNDILSLVPKGVMRVLSVGCGYGSTESELVKKGIEVFGIPIDCVVQASAEAQGIKVVPPSFETAKEALRGELFDCILFPDVIQHLPDPVYLIRDFMNMLVMNGCMIFSVPNFNHPSVIRKRMLGKIRFPKRNDKNAFKNYKLHITTWCMLNGWVKKCGLRVMESYYQIEHRYHLLSRVTLGTMDRNLSRDMVVLTKRDSAQIYDER